MILSISRILLIVTAGVDLGKANETKITIALRVSKDYFYYYEVGLGPKALLLGAAFFIIQPFFIVQP